MLETFRPGESIVWDCFWQATIFLGVGLGATIVLARRPARAHRLLLMAIVAGLTAPILAQSARLCGWGLLPQRVESPSLPVSSGETASIVTVDSPMVSRVSPPLPKLEHATKADGIGAIRLDGQRPVSPANAAARSSLPIGDWLRLPSFGWRSLALGGWLILTALAVVRLVTSLFLGVRMVHRARPLNDKTLTDSAFAAGVRLGVTVAPELRVSPQMRCPSIWCWGRRPVIVLPEDAAAGTSIKWVGVFCHELAHWLRGDHWWSVLGEVLVCALPWHPLAWSARHRLGQLSELACDDWVLASGLPATEYADSLLSLIPQRRGSMALAAVSSRRGLFGRVRHILDDRRCSPVVGMRWTCLSSAAMVLAASAVALAQTRPADKSQQSRLKDDENRLSTTAPLAASPKEKTKRMSVGGTVLGPDGKFIADATVFWLSYPKATLHPLAIPKDQKAQRATGADVLGETLTDANGKFALSADFDPERYNHQDGSNIMLLVKVPGMGMLAHPVEGGATEVALRLVPEVLIRGRLLTPSGVPAAGARVTLQDFFNDEMSEGMGVGMTPTDELIPRYWPKPRTTDADGRFTFHGLPQGTYVHLDFWHPDYAVDEVTIDTTSARGNGGVVKTYLKAFEIAPAPPTFTHTLEPARPVQGRVTDKQTGQPLAGVLVELSAMRRHGGTPFFGRTDADGRYRVWGHQAESYRTTVFPPADSEYLAGTKLQQSWPAGAKFLQKDFALDKGRFVRGKVIDADTKLPIAGAAVAYRPQSNNPNNRDEYALGNSVLTNAEGRFAITTLPGPGIVGVQTPDETYMQVPRGPLISQQGVVSIDVPKDGEVTPVEITVRKGAVLKAKVIGPDGKTLPDVAASCNGFAPMVMIHAWEPSAQGIFRLPGVDAAKTYRVFFLQPDRQLGAVVDLKPRSDSTQPDVVSLQPMAKIHGSVVNDSGSPADGAQIQPMIEMGRPKAGEMTRSEILRDSSPYVQLMGQKAMMSYFAKILEPKPRGEFVVDTLVPGIRFYIMAGAGHREAVVAVPPLKPGEDRDLGTITLKERKP